MIPLNACPICGSSEISRRYSGKPTRSEWRDERTFEVFGERIAARDPDRQTAEIHIRVALMNRFNALGTAEIVRVA